jgi:hypothetical protein
MNLSISKRTYKLLEQAREVGSRSGAFKDCKRIAQIRDGLLKTNKEFANKDAIHAIIDELSGSFEGVLVNLFVASAGEEVGRLLDGHLVWKQAIRPIAKFTSDETRRRVVEAIRKGGKRVDTPGEASEIIRAQIEECIGTLGANLKEKGFDERVELAECGLNKDLHQILKIIAASDNGLIAEKVLEKIKKKIAEEPDTYNWVLGRHSPNSMSGLIRDIEKAEVLEMLGLVIGCKTINTKKSPNKTRYSLKMIDVGEDAPKKKLSLRKRQARRIEEHGLVSGGKYVVSELVDNDLAGREVRLLDPGDTDIKFSGVVGRVLDDEVVVGWGKNFAFNVRVKIRHLKIPGKPKDSLRAF